MALYGLVSSTPLIQDHSGYSVQDMAHRRQPKRRYGKKKVRPGYDHGPKEKTVYVHYTFTATKTVTVGSDDSQGRPSPSQALPRPGEDRFDFGQLFDYERVLAAPTQTVAPAGRPSAAASRA